MAGPFGGGRGARSRARPDHGQATVELALVLPVVFALLMLLFQVALVGRDEILLVHAARDATRAATVTGDAAPIASAARRSLPSARVEVVRRGGVGDLVEVAVTYVSRTHVPLVGFLVPDITLHGRSVMRVETP